MKNTILETNQNHITTNTSESKNIWLHTHTTKTGFNTLPVKGDKISFITQNYFYYHNAIKLQSPAYLYMMYIYIYTT